MNSREHRRRRIEILRQPQTALAHAFLKALFDWASRHAAADDNQIVIPTGAVTSGELVKVVCALLATGRAS